MPRGDARKRAGATDRDGSREDGSRTYCGRVTLSGSFDNSLRWTAPKNAIAGDGHQPGDEYDVEHDPETGEIRYIPVDE